MDTGIRFSILGLLLFVQCVLFWEMGTKRKWMDKTIQVSDGFDNTMVVTVTLLFYLIQREFRLINDGDYTSWVWSLLGLVATFILVRDGIRTVSKFIQEMEDRKTSIGVTIGNTAYARVVRETYAYQLTAFILLMAIRFFLLISNSGS